MSRTWNHKRNWYGGVKKAVKEGCKKFSRAQYDRLCKKILSDLDLADEIVFDRYQDCDNWWNYI